MAMVLIGGHGEMQPTPYGPISKHPVFGGTCRQADFATTGAVGKLDLPIGASMTFAGTRNAAATACAMEIIRQTDANDTYADYYTADGVALSTLVTD